MKLDRALTSYLKDLVKSGDLSASTIRTYRIALQSAVRFLDSQGVGDTEEITPRHLDAYETVSGSTAHGQNQRMRVLRKLLEFVRHRRGGKNNPFDGRKLPGYRSAPPLRHTRPSADLLKSIRGREPRDLRDRAMIAILLDLPPMSTGTLARLRNDDYEDGIVRVDGNLYTLKAPARRMVDRYIQARNDALDDDEPSHLFVSFSRRSYGARLSSAGVCRTIQERRSEIETSKSSK